jgi:hypothetical protein
MRQMFFKRGGHYGRHALWVEVTILRIQAPAEGKEVND